MSIDIDINRNFTLEKYTVNILEKISHSLLTTDNDKIITIIYLQTSFYMFTLALTTLDNCKI